VKKTKKNLVLAILFCAYFSTALTLTLGALVALLANPVSSDFSFLSNATYAISYTLVVLALYVTAIALWWIGPIKE